MKTRMITAFLMAGFLVLGSGAFQQQWAQSDPEELVEKGDELFENDGLEDYKEALDLYEKAAEAAPENFKANWKSSKACRYYAEKAMNTEASDWEDINREYGKKGMEYGEKAMELEPEKPHGYYYYGLCVGSYSDSVGIVTALKEGLKNKTRDNLQKAYEIDKDFDNGGPIVALARFWQIVPWPFSDNDKALELYEEFKNSEHFSKDTSQALHHRVYMAELLADENRADEAEELLDEALEMTDDPYWTKYAEEILEDL